MNIFILYNPPFIVIFLISQVLIMFTNVVINALGHNFTNVLISYSHYICFIYR